MNDFFYYTMVKYLLQELLHNYQLENTQIIENGIYEKNRVYLSTSGTSRNLFDEEELRTIDILISIFGGYFVKIEETYEFFTPDSIWYNSVFGKAIYTELKYVSSNKINKVGFRLKHATEQLFDPRGFCHAGIVVIRIDGINCSDERLSKYIIDRMNDNEKGIGKPSDVLIIRDGQVIIHLK